MYIFISNLFSGPTKGILRETLGWNCLLYTIYLNFSGCFSLKPPLNHHRNNYALCRQTEILGRKLFEIAVS